MGPGTTLGNSGGSRHLKSLRGVPMTKPKTYPAYGVYAKHSDGKVLWVSAYTNFDMPTFTFDADVNRALFSRNREGAEDLLKKLGLAPGPHNSTPAYVERLPFNVG